MKMQNYTSIKSYISAQPKEIKEKLSEMYALVKGAAPKAGEDIKYGMPTFVGNRNLVHFAAMKGHLGFYPGPEAIEAFKSELATYSTSKGCIRFKYDEQIPKLLISKIVRFVVKSDRELK